MLSLDPEKGYSLGLRVTDENVLFEADTQSIYEIPRGQIEVPNFQKSWQVNTVTGAQKLKRLWVDSSDSKSYALCYAVLVRMCAKSHNNTFPQTESFTARYHIGFYLTSIFQ